MGTVTMAGSCGKIKKATHWIQFIESSWSNEVVKNNS